MRFSVIVDNKSWTCIHKFDLSFISATIDEIRAMQNQTQFSLKYKKIIKKNSSIINNKSLTRYFKI